MYMYMLVHARTWYMHARSCPAAYACTLSQYMSMCMHASACTCNMHVCVMLHVHVHAHMYVCIRTRMQAGTYAHVHWSAHVATLLVLNHVAVGTELAERLARVDVLEQLVDLLGEVAVDDVGALVWILAVEDRSLDVTMALVASDLQAEDWKVEHSEWS